MVAPGRVEFQVLGALEVVVEGARVEIGSRKQRMLLCALAACPHRTVSVDALVGLLWTGRPPASVDVTLRGLVSRLRRALGPAGDRLTWRGGGYLLRAEPDEVDADRFMRLVARGRDELAAGTPERAAMALRNALALWRGPALADVGEAELVQVSVARLTEAHATAVEVLAEAELAAGRPAAAVHLMELHLDTYPLRERAWELLILALYRLGRQADALTAYRRARRLLRDELAVDPNPALRRLQNRILVQDPGLDHHDDADRGGPGASRHNNLPVAPNPLVGRADQLTTLTAELAQTRLLTLTGVGGVGKTRLALQLATDLVERWDTVRLVELAPLEPDARVDAEVARALGVAEGVGNEILDRLAEHLVGRRVLLVLDNCEHVLGEAASVVDALLRTCPQLAVLATSREPLGVAGEVVWPVPPLSLPSEASANPDELAGSAAVALFCARGRAAQVGFGLTADNAAAVRTICRRLDGIPLALELAAARLRALGAHQVAVRLDDRFALLTGGTRTALPRHQTLSATMDWSYRLLTPNEQAGLRALTVFPGDFDLVAATAVIPPRPGVSAEDLVFRLIDKSLVVVRRRAGDVRYRLLETVRSFGSGKLAQHDETSTARRRHREHYRRVATGWRQSRFLTAAWSRGVAVDEDNLRAAVASALADRDGDAALQLLAGLWPYWTLNGRTEAVGWLEQALALDGQDLIARAEVTMGLALLLALWEIGPAERAEQLSTTALRLADRAGDNGCHSWAHFFHGEVLSSRGNQAAAHAEYRTALSLVQQPARAAAFHHSLGWVALAHGDATGAQAEFETAVAYGDDGELHVTHAQAALAVLLAGRGECGAAADLAAEAVAAARRFRLPGVLVMALTRCAQTRLRCCDHAGARETLHELFTLLHQLGTLPFRAEALEAAAVLAHRTGDNRRAASCLAAAQAVRIPRGEGWAVDVLGPDLAATRAAVGTVTDAKLLNKGRQLLAADTVAEVSAWLEHAAAVIAIDRRSTSTMATHAPRPRPQPNQDQRPHHLTERRT